MVQRMIKRDLEVIDQELRLLAAVRRVARQLGGKPSTAAVDQLLDERAAITTADPVGPVVLGRGGCSS